MSTCYLNPKLIEMQNQFIASIIARISEYCNAVIKHADEIGLTKIVLFGSTARGECTARSDIDLLFLLNPEASISRAETFLWFDLEIDPERRFEGDIAIDAHVMHEDTFYDKEIESVFLSMIRKDGVILWPKTEE